MKRIYLVTLIICISIIPFKQAFSQTGIPGVTEADYEKFNAVAVNLWGPDYFSFGIMNVDSSLGNLSVSNGRIVDPYSTLSNCYIFMFGAEEINLQTPKAGICIYNYRNEQVVWNSDTLIFNDNIMAAYTYATRDLNNDGNVEIITSWVYSHRFGPEYLWIFSWDGYSGRLINSVDEEEKQSIIYSDARAGFDFVDVDGDGILEIQGWPMDEDDEPITYSWNGQLYGKWPDTPQPSSTTFYPRDRIAIEFHAFVDQLPNGYEYQYVVHSQSTSIQDIDDIKVECQIDSVDTFYVRKDWEFYFWDHLLGWSNDIFRKNLIVSGESDSSCVYESRGLPKIVRYFVQGFNQTPTGDYNGEQWWQDVQNNSASGFTIGAADPPDPFIPSVFLDTLMTYPQRSYELEWITNQGILNSLNQKLDNAKKQLDKGKTKQAINMLNAFLNEVEAQNGKHLTSEAYALLKYNAEYLIEKLEE